VIIRNLIPIKISVTVFGITMIGQDYDSFLSTIVLVALFALIFAQFSERIEDRWRLRKQ